MRILFLFASIILLCYFYANLLLRCHYYCITMCSFRVLNINRGKSNKTIQKQQHYYTVDNRHICIPFLYMFANILLLCFMYANFLFHFHYSCITIFLLLVFTEVYTTSQRNNSNNKEEGRYRLWYFV